MSVILFALIGASLNMGTAYWVCFGIHCFAKIMDFFLED